MIPAAMRVDYSVGEKLAKKRINAKEFVQDVRSELSDLDLMLKYDLNDDDLSALFKKLIAAKMLTEDDLRERASTVSRASRDSEADTSNREAPKSPVPEPAAALRMPAQTDARSTPPPRGHKQAGTQTCPACSKEIPYEAVRCPHCRAWVDGRDVGLDPDIATAGDRSHALKVVAKGIAGMLVGLMTVHFGGKVGLFVGTLLFLASTGYYVWGCCVYIGTKGYHMATGLLGLIPCFIGLIILYVMPEK